jgi:hypothetical protein
MVQPFPKEVEYAASTFSMQRAFSDLSKWSVTADGLELDRVRRLPCS